MATFSFLTPPSVPVVGVNCLGRCNKGPNCRILNSSGAFVEASTVRSVESVVELLQDHLQLNVNITSAEVLRLNYEGNVHLRSGELDEAIECYTKAINLGDREQEGVLLVMRGTALLQRAYVCRMRHKGVLSIAAEVLPTVESVRTYLDAVSSLGAYMRYKITYDITSRVAAIFSNIETSPRWVDAKVRWPEASEGPFVASGQDLLGRVIFSWSLYEYALMGALLDLLLATNVMPGFSQAWRRAGDALGELRQFNSAIEYYEVAIRLDSSLEEILVPTIEKFKLTMKLIDNACDKGLPIEMIMALIED